MAGQDGFLRGLDQYGFFHLTFEEYLVAWEVARQRVEGGREMLKQHWSDRRWHEVFLLTAGQLGIVIGGLGAVSFAGGNPQPVLRALQSAATRPVNERQL